MKVNVAGWRENLSLKSMIVCLSASQNPLQFAIASIASEDIRRVVVKRFPYAVYFRVEMKRIVVLAVFHSGRSPSIWRSRK